MGGNPLPEYRQQLSSRRFIIDSCSISGDTAILGIELFRHIVQVLRLAEGEAVTLVDENGCEHDGVISHVGKHQVSVAIRQSNRMTEEGHVLPLITVCQALPKGEKIDLILQKGTELGVHDFWLFGGQRSIVQVREEQLAKKLVRWNRITTEAARQCRRRTVPVVRWFPTAAEAAAAATQSLRLILWEDECINRLKDFLSGSSIQKSIIIAIGPEGGFAPTETTRFTERDFQSISLGSRILRTETAAIAIVAIIQYIIGDI